MEQLSKEIHSEGHVKYTENFTISGCILMTYEPWRAPDPPRLAYEIWEVKCFLKADRTYRDHLIWFRSHNFFKSLLLLSNSVYALNFTFFSIWSVFVLNPFSTIYSMAAPFVSHSLTISKIAIWTKTDVSCLLNNW